MYVFKASLTTLLSVCIREALSGVVVRPCGGLVGRCMASWRKLMLSFPSTMHPGEARRVLGEVL
jgi:hypothetical protein